MTAWLLAALAGLAFAALQYGRLVVRDGAGPGGLALLRALAVFLLVALLLDVRIGREILPAPLVALDASRSWTRGGTTRWDAALARARTLGGDSLLLVGDSVRLARGAARPTDAASVIGTIAEQAIAQGRPLVVVTDGEIAATDAASIARLPRGSRFEVLTAPAAVDAAVAALDVPRALQAGDTLRASVTLRTGAAPVPAGTVTLRLDDAVIATAPVAALAAYAAHDVVLTARIGGARGERLLRADVAVAGDVEPRNDTLAAALDVSSTSSAVWISSAPDLDGRTALAVLRGALSVPTQGFLRVAPGTWRIEGSLAPVSEAAVRVAARDAAMLVLHGDTSVFGSPRRIAPGSPLALLPGPGRPAATAAAGALDEWYPTAAPPSPASAALAGIPWDSLAPVSLGGDAPAAAPSGNDGWVALAGRRGRRGDAVPLVVGAESPRRIVIARATGMWRWKARGGAGAIAYDGLWGSIFDWLADARRDRRAAVPERGSVRDGEAVGWRLSPHGDSAVQLTLTPRRDGGRAQTVTLRRVAGSIVTDSPAPGQGIYDVVVPGGRTMVVVNAPEELLPRRPTVRNGPAGSGAVAAGAPALRDYGIAYALVVALLCAEWVLRRRRGLQ